jgi:hypothetical protein
MPQKCHEGMTNQIYDWLEGSEKFKFADNWTPGQDTAMNDSFRRDLAAGKLCGVDFEEVFP